MSTPIRVVLADDHAIVRGSLAAWLRACPDVEVVADVGDAEAAVEAAIRHQPRVVVLDIDMPGLICFDAARTITQRCAEARVIFLSAYSNDSYIEEALAVGAAGYLTKSMTPQALADGIRAVAAGGTCFAPEVQSRIVIDDAGARLASGHTRASRLTAREVEVLRYIARGLSKKEIADTMRLSVKTVDNHCTNLMAKLDIHDRVELARYAIREGVAEA